MAARAKLSEQMHFTKLKPARARVLVGVIEQYRAGELIARIEGHIDNCFRYPRR